MAQPASSSAMLSVPVPGRLRASCVTLNLNPHISKLTSFHISDSRAGDPWKTYKELYLHHHGWSPSFLFEQGVPTCSAEPQKDLVGSTDLLDRDMPRSEPPDTLEEVVAALAHALACACACATSNDPTVGTHEEKGDMRGAPLCRGWAKWRPSERTLPGCPRTSKESFYSTWKS